VPPAPQQDRPQSAARAVLLLHTLPDASSHFDLLLERRPESGAPTPDPDDRRLITFRLPNPLPPASVTELEVERAPDHRAFYLDHEGPVSDARGHVQRAFTAHLTDLHETEDTVRATLSLDQSIIMIDAERIDSNRWRLLLTRS